MSSDLEELAAAALELSEEDRADLLVRLMESLDGPPDADVEQAWADEIARRLEEVRSGKVETIPWAEVRKRLMDDADGDAG